MADQYVQRPQGIEPTTIVEAMKYDADSVVDVVGWYSANTYAMVSDEGAVSMFIQTPEAIVPLHEGQWLVRDGLGSLSGQTPQEFDAGYDPL